MMKGLNKTKENLAVLLVVVFQVFNASCSKQIYTVSSTRNVGSPVENRRLKTFMDAGVEKKTDTHNTSPDEIIKTAQKYLGVPHCMGGTTVKCMDCSGLLFTVFARHGISLPHSSEEQARYGRIITGMDKLIKGDLVFFVRSYKTHQFITHSGIYIGSNKFIHTSTTNGVTITSLYDPWWKEKFIFGTRVLE
jgi:murein DD-endopeptidase / murein LD-carboxypeptidase